VRYLSIAVAPGTYQFGIVNPSEVAVSSGSNTVTNDGNTAETFWIKGSNTTNWTLASSAGTDQFVLSCLFNTTQPTTGNFGSEDKLTTTSQASTGSVFAGNETGVSVLAGQKRYSWFKFDAPTALSAAHPQQAIEVTLTAQAP